MSVFIGGLLLATMFITGFELGGWLMRNRLNAEFTARLDQLTEAIAGLEGPGPAQPNVPSDTARLSHFETVEAEFGECITCGGRAPR